MADPIILHVTLTAERNVLLWARSARRRNGLWSSPSHRAYRLRRAGPAPAALIAVTSSRESGGRRRRQAGRTAGLMSSAAAASADRSGSTWTVPWAAVTASCDTR